MFTKRQFYVAAIFSFFAITGVVFLLMDRVQQHAFEKEARTRIKLVANFGKACRQYAKKTLRPAVEKLTDEMIFEAMSSTVVVRGVFESFNKKMAEYRYRQAALNPLNLVNRADDYETAMIARFREDPKLKEISGCRSTEGCEQFFMARPIVVEASCLKCHGNPETAPAAIVQRYGREHGYHWQVGDTESVRIVSVPTEELHEQYASIRYATMSIFGILTIGLIGVSCLLFTKVEKNNSTLRHLWQAMESNPDSIMITDASGVIQYVNPKYTHMTGYANEEVVGQQASVFQPAARSSGIRKKIWDRVSVGGEWRGELENRRKNGESYWESISISPSVDAMGTVTHFTIVAEDISERKQADEQLKRFRAALDNSADAMFLIDRSTMQFVDLNHSACVSTGYSREELLNMGPQDIKPLLTKDQLAERFDQIIHSATGTGRIETLHRCKDGTSFPVEVALRALVNDSGTFLIASVRDVTQRKQAELELEAMNLKLRDTARQAGKAEIATEVLHNVGNVLNSVNVSANLIREQVDRSHVSDLVKAAALMEEHLESLETYLTQDEKGKILPQFLVDISKQVASDEQTIFEEATFLIDNIDHIKAIVASQQSLAGVSGVIEKVSLPELLEDAIQIEFCMDKGDSVRIVRELDDVDPVFVDKQKLLQVVVNLIGNARMACLESGQESKQITLRLHRSSRDEDVVSIEVCDNGVGIPAENLTRIFAHGFTTRKEGRGFGLHSAAILAKELNGNLAAFSDGPDSGAMFRLDIPYEREQQKLAISW